MRRVVVLVMVAGFAGCKSAPAPAGAVSLDRRADDRPIALVDPSDPVGVSPTGRAVARVVAGADTGYRMIDSTGAVAGKVAVPGIGVWLADARGGFATMAPGATGIATIGPDGSAGRTITFKEPGITRGVWGDSIDVVRLFGDGFKVIRLAADGSGERELVGSTTPQVTEMLGIGKPGAKIVSPDAALPSVTTTPSRVVIGNGLRYHVMLFDPAGKLVGEIVRTQPNAHPTPRQVDREIAQLRQSQQLTDRYLAGVRAQIAKSNVPFFSPQQGIRFDGAGRLWVVGYDADSAFADVFADTTFVKRLPIQCPGFDGSWDLAGEWLVVACGRRETPDTGGELVRYRITTRR